MRKLFYLFIASLFLCTLSYGQILLPVEVLGDEGKIVARKVTLTNDIASSTQKLWLQVNNLGYEDKASIRINDGTWYTLNHESVDMHRQEKARGGMVHGGFNTIRFSIPATGFQEGENIIRFRFDKSDGISMGYRVIRLNLLNAQDKKLLDESYFEEDNPDEWVGPFTDAQSIAEGEDLWRNADLWTSKYPGKWYAYDLGGFTPIQAKCADCHTQDGRDLELFAYSNDAIIERSKFHNLSEMDGKKIASYIRSLSAKDDKINRAGRPWNPPYQPGPELKGKSIEYWAAGAGLDAVLENDIEMKEHLFPNGVSQETMHEYFDSDKIENVTEIPISIQLPDWKHWLPLIHPKDAYTKNDYWNDFTIESNPQRAYLEMREFLESGTLNALGVNKVEQSIRNFWSNNRKFLLQGGSVSKHWRTPDGDATKNLKNGVPREFAATSLAKLMGVKFFEVYNEFDLQDKASLFIDAVDQPSDRQWVGNFYQVFEVPAHFQACVEAEGASGGCDHFLGQPLETGKFESTAWYHLQSIINPGMGRITSTAPVDWNYHPRHILDASYTSDVEEPLRYFQSLNLMYQTRTWSGDNGPKTEGFRIRNMGPWIAYGWDGNNRTGGYENGVFPTFLDDIEPGMSKWVINAQLRQFLDEMAKPKNALDNWYRVSGDDWGSEALESANITEADLDMNEIMTKNPFGHYVEKIYYVIPEYAKMGVDCGILNELIDWSEEAWPLLNWDQFRNISNPQVVLYHQNECDNFIEARVANTGNNPVYNWTVNGTEVSEESSRLSREFYKNGDVVSIRMNGTSSCAVKTGPTQDNMTVSNLMICEKELPIDSAYYSFDDNDYSAGISDQWNDNHLTNVGATRMENGQRTYASFDGIDDVMNGQVDALQFNSSDITVEAWINLNTDLGSTQRIVTLNPSGVLLFRLNPNGQFQTVMTSDIETSTKVSVNTSEQMTTNTWVHLAAVISSTNVQLYVNGEMSTSQVLSAPIDFDGTGTGLQVVLGNNATTSPEGMIDEVKIYNRTLSANEIKQSFDKFNVITGVQSTLSSELTVYPNPAKEQLNLEFFSENEENTLVNLTSIDGRIIYTKEVSVQAGTNTITLDLSTLEINEGIFFLHLKSNQDHVTKKIMIEK